MKENKEKGMSLKAKEKILHAVFKEYHYAKETLEKMQDENYFPKIQFDYVMHEDTHAYQLYENKLIGRIDKVENSQKLIAFVDDLLARLPQNEMEIVQQEYILHARSDWWRKKYARSSYYRMKNRALEHMLDYLMLS